jgi:formate-dependent phosphoribosylglycinamide formyltransferase (GAR transformylase)
MKPRILLVSTSRWFATARLAMAFGALDCDVEAVCPHDHPVSRTGAVSAIHRFRPLRPVQSIARAIERSRPDLLIPCDDLATICLHRLHDRAARAGTSAGDATCALLVRSLGSASAFDVVGARSSLMTLAQRHGVRVPLTSVTATVADLNAWVREQGVPTVLKADATCGGRGVRIAETPVEAAAAWQALNAPPSAARAIKRFVVNRDGNYILPCVQRTYGVVNTQRFIRGQDANVTVACWQGKVLASVSAAVLRTTEPHGPASVVELIANSEMTTAVEKIVSALGLSGLAGFDFIIEDHSGFAYLIELNPRATQMGHLPLDNGRDLPRALLAALTGTANRDRPAATTKNVIALFPQEWLRDSDSAFLSSGFHDVPWSEASLLRTATEETIAHRLWTAMMARPNAPRPSTPRKKARLEQLL